MKSEREKRLIESIESLRELAIGLGMKTAKLQEIIANLKSELYVAREHEACRLAANEENFPNSNANAKLKAAATDLLEALELVDEGLEHWEYGDDPRGAYGYRERVKAAISKAYVETK